MHEVTIISVTYGHMPYKLPGFVYQVLAQTSPNWKLIIAHDGPSSDGSKEFMESICKDYPKIKYFESSEREHYPDARVGYGHFNRARMLDMVDTEWVWFQNSDNQIIYDAVHHLNGNMENPNFDLITFPIAHSYFGFTAFHNWFDVNQVDMAQFIIRTDIAKDVGFNHRVFEADGLFARDVITKYPNIRQHRRDCILTVHN